MPTSQQVYIAAPLTSIDEARALAAQIAENGHTVVSTWHIDRGNTVAKETKLDHAAKQRIAHTCLEEVRAADVMVCLYDPSARVGHVIELGIAIDRQVEIYVIRRDAAAPVPTLFLDALYVTEVTGLSDIARLSHVTDERMDNAPDTHALIYALQGWEQAHGGDPTLLKIGDARWFVAFGEDAADIADETGAAHVRAFV
jgi:nucleoside 2-deoxyribosyltransferase